MQGPLWRALFLFRYQGWMMDITVRGLACSVAFFLAAPLPLEAAGNKVAGRQKAQLCQGCHGLDGLAKVPGAPHLAGQDEVYFVKALGDYKSGARKNEAMSVVIEQITPADYADLAAYYASLSQDR